MFEHFAISGEYCWSEVTIDDIVQFSVYMKHTKIPEITHPGISHNINWYYNHMKVIVDDNIPSNDVFLYCLINCSTACLECIVQNKDNTEYIFDMRFIWDVLVVMGDRKLEYTILFYVICQLFENTDSEIQHLLLDISNGPCEDESGLSYNGERPIIPDMDAYSKIDSILAKIPHKYYSANMIPYETLVDSDIYINYWDMKKINIKSARNI